MAAAAADDDDDDDDEDDDDADKRLQCFLRGNKKDLITTRDEGNE